MGIEHRQRFFQYSLPNKKVKECITGKNEDKFSRILENIGYKENSDFEKQYPVGCAFVVDIAFPKVRLAIEIDGKSHNSRKQKNKDLKRDLFLRENGWIVLRIKDEEFYDRRLSFNKYLIKYIVDERVEQLKTGVLQEIEIPEYIEGQYGE